MVPAHMTPVLSVRGLGKTYVEESGDRSVRHEILRGLDLDLAPAELVAILGKSGSGKSTLLNLLAAIDTPDAGTITFGARDLAATSDRERTLFRRQHLGFVFQAFHLLPTLTVLENVMLPRALERSPGAARARARALLEAVGLADREASFPDRLSGGEQQRVAIARALVNDPALLLADEPTGNLDPETGRLVLDIFVRLARQEKRTVVLVTHGAEVAAAADRRLRLVDGRLVPEA